MQRKAIVADVGESWIDLLTLDEEEKAHDEACRRNVGCGSSGCGCRVSGRPFRAAIPENIPLKAGDTVEVSSPSGLGASSLVLGLPIAGAAAGWFLVTRLFPGAGEVYSAIAAFLGALISGGLVFTVGGRKRETRLPEIVAVVDERAAM